MKHTKKEIEEQRAKLKGWLPKGSTVFTVCEHVSRSGMMRHIRLLAFQRDESGKVVLSEQNGEPWMIHPNYGASVVLGYTQVKQGGDGLKVGGCGMDMGFHLVYSLSQALHGDGYALNHRWL